MSTTQVLPPIAAAFAKADEFLGGGRPWRTANDRQALFLKRVYTQLREVLARIPEIESVVGRSADEINAFLLRRGFDILLDPFTDPHDFGVASVLDVLVEWVQPGTVTSIRAMGREFPGVRIPKKWSRLDVLRDPAFPNPIACLATKSGDRVYLTVLDAARVPDLITSTTPLPSLDRSDEWAGYGGIVFPMVSLDQKVDISWLRGLSTTGVDGLPAIVTQAMQQTKFRMNEVGARAESAVALGATRGFHAPKPDLVIDRPFLCWIERRGVPFPLFLGHITEEDWKNPGSLGR